MSKRRKFNIDINDVMDQANEPKEEVNEEKKLSEKKTKTSSKSKVVETVPKEEKQVEEKESVFEKKVVLKEEPKVEVKEKEEDNKPEEEDDATILKKIMEDNSVAEPRTRLGRTPEEVENINQILSSIERNENLDGENKTFWIDKVQWNKIVKIKEKFYYKNNYYVVYKLIDGYLKIVEKDDPNYDPLGPKSPLLMRRENPSKKKISRTFVLTYEHKEKIEKIMYKYSFKSINEVVNCIFGYIFDK